jgi:FlaA1/EpsC-like NDP-sugar epimerase
MFVQLRNINFYVIFFIDLVLFSLAFYGAYLLRFDFVPSDVWVDQFFELLPFVVAVKSLSFFAMQLYKGMFRYAGLSDLWRMCKAVGLSSLVIMAGILVFYRFQGFSRGVFLIDAGLTLLFAGGFRLLVRLLFKEYLSRKEGRTGIHLFRQQKPQTPVLIFGAGDAGEKLFREITENPRLNYEVKGFGDDNPHKKGRSIHGVPVLGGAEDLARIRQVHGIKEVFIAMPSSTGRQMRAVVEACKACDLSFKTLPGLGELVDGKVDVKVMRQLTSMCPCWSAIPGRPCPTISGATR